MNFKSKDEAVLLSELKSLVAREREVMTEILHYLREIESRKIHLERGYPSLFEFSVKELGYSAGAAHRRISAMRLLKAVPELEVKIQSGELSLSVAAQAQKFFREEGKTRKISTSEKKETVESLLGLSTRECERKLAAISPSSALPKERERVVTDELTQIQFLADRDLMEKLDRLKGLLAHQNFEGGYTKLFHRLADLALKKLAPTTPAQNESARQAKETPHTRVGTPNEKSTHLQTRSVRTPRTISQVAQRSRFIPVRTKAEVYQRDGGKCVYRDRKSGKTCGSSHALEYDHILPYAMGGENSANNLRLLCSAHHRLESERLNELI